jgi:hypothetical protein
MPEVSTAANLRLHHRIILHFISTNFPDLYPLPHWSSIFWQSSECWSDFRFPFEYVRALLTFNSPSLQMLSQRILARRLPQVAARHAIAPRASFSQVAALRASEAEDPLQVQCVSCGGMTQVI